MGGDQRAKPPDPKTSRCDWLEVRLATEIHKALRNSQLASWGEKCLPGTNFARETIPLTHGIKSRYYSTRLLCHAPLLSLKAVQALREGQWRGWRSSSTMHNFSGYFAPAQSNSNWRPISEAVAHVANRIGETDAEKCLPEARKRLRQAAYDKKLKIRGRKQLADRRATRDGDYADIHTDISNDYWSATELSAMATSQSRPNQPDCHTDPETAYAWGPKVSISGTGMRNC